MTCARAKDVRLACQMHPQYFRARRCEHLDARHLFHRGHPDRLGHRRRLGHPGHLFHLFHREHRGHPGALGD